jgi:hypothetical protein
MLLLHSVGNHSQLLEEQTLPISESWNLIIEDLVIPHHPNALGC